MASVSFGTSPSPFPKSLSYAVSRLNNYSRRKVRLVESSATTGGPNSTIKIVMPSEVVDLSTFTIYFKLTTTTTAGNAGVAHVEDLVDSYTLVSGGIALTPQFQYADAWTLFKDFQLGDKKSVRKMLSSKLSAAPNAKLTNEPCALYSLLGFFNSASPRCVDFGLFPSKTELNIRLAGIEALVGDATCAGQSFAISDFYCECDCLSLPDVYYQSMNAFLSAGQILEIPYQSIQTFTASAGSINGLSQQFSIASQSVDAIITTVYDATNRTSNVWDSVQEGNTRFARGASALTDVNIRINNVPQIAYGAATADRSAISCISELVGLDDTAGASHPNMDTLDRFKTKFYAHVLRLNHRDNSFGNALISGMNTLANPASVMVNWSGSGTTSCLPMTHVLTTSSILVGQGKAVEMRQ